MTNQGKPWFSNKKIAFLLKNHPTKNQKQPKKRFDQTPTKTKKNQNLWSAPGPGP